MRPTISEIYAAGSVREIHARESAVPEEPQEPNPGYAYAGLAGLITLGLVVMIGGWPAVWFCAGWAAGASTMATVWALWR